MERVVGVRDVKGYKIHSILNKQDDTNGWIHVATFSLSLLPLSSENLNC